MSSTITSTNECPICQENFPAGFQPGKVKRENNITYQMVQKPTTDKTPISLKCGHIFCKTCVYQSLAKTNNLCPLCRHEIYKVSEEPQVRDNNLREGAIDDARERPQERDNSFRARIFRREVFHGSHALPGFQILNNLKQICIENYADYGNFPKAAANYLGAKALAVITVPTNILSLFLSVTGMIGTLGLNDYMQKRSVGSLLQTIKSIQDMVWLDPYNRFGA